MNDLTRDSFRNLGDPAQDMRESRFLAELHSALFESETPEQLAQCVLPLLAAYGGWQAAELWLFYPGMFADASPEHSPDACALVACWLAPDLRTQPYAAEPRQRANFGPQPRWLHPGGSTSTAGRRWRTTVTAPLRSATREIGALVFSTADDRPEDSRMLAQLAQIGIQLGQWFHRHDSEQRLRRSEERFRALMESAPDALVITDENGIVTMANRQTERLFGWKREQLIGQPIEMLMPMRFRTRHLHHRDHYAAQPHARPMGIGMELAALRADGTEFPVEISLSPIRIDGQTLVAAAIRDASERREMERTQRRLHDLEMAQAEHLATLGQLAAGMAHEIKNPLAGMSAALEVLASQNDLPAAAQEIMGEIQHQATRIRRIVDELLNYARPRPAELILADLNATVEQTIPFASLQAQARGVRLAFHPATLPPVWHDPEQLHRLVLNLLVNAIDASRPGEEVELSTAAAPEGNAVTVCVSDHGSGIAPDDLERIFVPFYTTKGSRGTGLGLSLCRRIAELHGGTLTVTSTPGTGSRFTLALPLRTEPDGLTCSGVHLDPTKDPAR